jgi:6-pyruvoyl-tetrahydropterin synthase
VTQRVFRSSKIVASYWRELSFEAAHKLPEHPSVHGHSYRVRLIWSGIIPTTGQLISEQDALAACSAVSGLLDHKMLNDILGDPTCENIAKFILCREEETHRASRVIVWRPTVGDGAEVCGV